MDPVNLITVKIIPASGQWLRKRAKELARKLLRFSGSIKRNEIVEGYLISAQTKDGDATVYVIDLPAKILWMSRVTFNAGGEWFFAPTATFNFRDAFTPEVEVDVPATAVTADNTSRLTPQVYKYVAPDYELVLSGDGRAYVHGLPAVDGEWVYGITHMRIDADGGATPPIVGFIAVVYGAKWDTPQRPLDVGNALVVPPDPPPDPTVEPLSSRVVSISMDTVAAASGNADIVFRQLPNDVFIAALQAQTVTVGENPPLTSLYVAVGGADTDPESPIESAVVVVGRVDIVPGQAQSVAWGVAPTLSADYLGGSTLNVLESIGLHVDEAVTVVVVAHANYGGGDDYYTTRQITIDRDTGAVLANDSLTTEDQIAHPICTTSNGVWVAVADVDGTGLATDCVLYRVNSTDVTPVNLTGWLPITTLLPGVELSDDLWALGAMLPAAVQLSENRVGILACPEDTYEPSDAIPWHLLEIDELTMEIVSVRGTVGTMSLLQLVFGMPRFMAVTLVSPQELDDEGEVVRPAVLLLSRQTKTSLSTDGGTTWHEVATGVSGYPYYFGNSAHAFVPGVGV